MKGHLRDLVSLTKPRITIFVVMTAFVGFAAGLRGPLASLDPVLLLHTLLGTALVASGTSAFNQIWEVSLDARMKRTAKRPLPAGRLGMTEAIAFASILSVAGIAELWLYANPITSFLAAFTLVSYVCVYTPMKTRSPLSTLVGSLPGALPPLGGFTASHGTIAAPGLALFAILFLWQLPHFFAIGWRLREDYARAGVRILSTVDPTGRRLARQSVLFSLALLPASLAPAWIGSAGWIYAVGATSLTLVFCATAIRFARQISDERALALFLASIAWLPAVLILYVLDRVV
jgi:protoheme IX farnesyltransferase